MTGLVEGVRTGNGGITADGRHGCGAGYRSWHRRICPPALEEGIDIKIVSERLNHSSTHVTREIYTHVTPPMQSDAAERVAGRIFRRGP